MTKAQKLTIELIRYEISDIPVTEELITDMSDELIEEIYVLSNNQDVAYIVGSALSKLNVLNGDAKSAFFNEQLSSIFRSERLSHELESVCTLFEKNKIFHIPLKGSVLRNYYPKPEMRTSCDMDILIHKDDLEGAKDLLCSHLGYSFYRNGSHDVAFMSESGAELELHFRLYETDGVQKDILDKVWDCSMPCKGYTYKCEMQPEFYVFYHIFHMSKHFKNGGCGLRPFLDLWILKNNFPYDEDKLQSILSSAGLNKFAKAAFKTAFVWYGSLEGDETTELIEEYIFNAGIYGNFENMVAISVAKSGSKIKEFLSRVFQPRILLKNQFPILEKYPFLTPFYEVKRWHRIIFKDKSRVQFEIARQNAALTDEKRKQAVRLVDELGLR